MPSSHSPVRDTQGQILPEHLPCASHSVCVGEQGSCVIPDLSELIAQLVTVSPQSCWPLVCSLRQAAFMRQELYGWAISLAPGLPLFASPLEALSSGLHIISTPPSNLGSTSLFSRNSSTCHIHEHRWIGHPHEPVSVLCAVLVWDRKA